MKVLHFIFQLRDFGTHLIVQICYNLLSYRRKDFTGKYDTKIQTASRVAQATLALLTSVRLRSSSQISSKTEIARSLLKWSIFQIVTSDDIDHII